MERTLKAYVVDVELTWGYQVGIAGLSKSQPTYLYPPPTTILGAIAEAIGRKEELGEASFSKIYSALTKDLVAVNIRPLNYIPIRYKDISRILMVTYKTGQQLLYPTPKDIGKSFDAPSRGKTIASPLKIGEPPKLRIILIWRKMPRLKLKNNTVLLSEKYLWRIHRLGSKESIVSVTNVIPCKVSIITERCTSTRYSFPLRSVEIFNLLSGKLVFETYSDPFVGDLGSVSYVKGKTITYAVPILRNLLIEPIIKVKISEIGILLEACSEKIIGVRKS